MTPSICADAQGLRIYRDQALQHALTDWENLRFDFNI